MPTDAQGELRECLQRESTDVVYDEKKSSHPSSYELPSLLTDAASVAIWRRSVRERAYYFIRMLKLGMDAERCMCIIIVTSFF